MKIFLELQHIRFLVSFHNYFILYTLNPENLGLWGSYLPHNITIGIMM